MSTEPKNPNGSNTLFKSDNSFLLVRFDLTAGIVMLNLNWSMNGRQQSPKDFMISPSPRFRIK